MTGTPIDPVDDATLVAWLDGELESAQAAQVARAVDASAALGERARMLRATRTELAGFLSSSDPPEPRAMPKPGVLLSAAALLVVAVIGFLAREDDGPEPGSPAENRWLAVRAIPVRGGWPLFGAIAFEIDGRSKSERTCRIVAREPDESDEALAARLSADPQQQLGIPLVLDAELVGPDGARWSGIVRNTQGEFGPEGTRLAVLLEDVVVRHAAINPLLGMRATDGAWVEDWWHQYRARGDIDVGGAHGFVPELPGDWRVTFTLRSFTPAGDSRWPTFAEPLRFDCGFRVEGETGPWSEAVDGLRARIVASARDASPGSPLAIALQIENRSDRPRAYNVTGVTMAVIPQPYHFDLLVDGEACTQRDGLGVISSAGAGFLPQPVGSLRTMGVLTSFWRRDGEPPLETPGPHRLAFRFHFEPSIWSGDDRALWMGKIETPAITIDVAARR